MDDESPPVSADAWCHYGNQSKIKNVKQEASDHRVIMRLVRLGGWTQKEIATVVGKTDRQIRNIVGKKSGTSEISAFFEKGKKIKEIADVFGLTQRHVGEIINISNREISNTDKTIDKRRDHPKLQKKLGPVKFVIFSKKARR